MVPRRGRAYGFAMTGRPMTVTFQKRKRTCGWSALRPPRTVVPGSTMAAGGDLPHDLATYVVELALGIEHGFWGCVAEGGTFRSLGRKRTPQGTAVIARHSSDLDTAEVQVNAVVAAWRRGEATPADAALDEMLARWRSLPDGGTFDVVWPASPARRPRPARA